MTNTNEKEVAELRNRVAELQGALKAGLLALRAYKFDSAEAHFEGVSKKEEGLQAELDILVEQILSAKDLAKLQEVTRMNYPDQIPDTTKKVEGAKNAQADSEGWITFYGDECPVPADTIIEVSQKSNGLGKPKPRQRTYIDKANSFTWSSQELQHAVGTYRIIEEPELDRKYCGSIHAIGECELCKDKEPEKKYQCKFDEYGNWSATLKEPKKKQTLLEYANIPDNYAQKWIFCKISQYLEERGL